MIYDDIISIEEFHQLEGKEVWVAEISDHPSYSFAHEILDVPINDLVIFPLASISTSLSE